VGPVTPCTSAINKGKLLAKFVVPVFKFMVLVIAVPLFIVAAPGAVIVVEALVMV
jgi:hypothetical protein